MISSISSRSNPSSLFTSRLQQTEPSQPSQAAQDSAAAALRNKLFHTDSFQAQPATGTQAVQSTTPSARPAGAGSDPVSASTLVSKSSHDASRDYPAVSYSEDKLYNNKSLGFWKKEIWDTATQAGATPEEAAVLVAQAMQEGGTDYAKKGDSTNYGPFNLNEDLLKNYGKHLPANLQDLNKETPEAIKLNVTNALDAMRAMGANNYLHHVRGGRTNFEHPEQRISNNPNVKADDAFAFERSISNNARLFLESIQANPSALTSNQRFASDIPNI
ncbi:hypothetical protein NR800_21820 [Corallococcus interemptor]|uniref:hypothetical protein n=1 Tax=Corallococcus TaxID=83461 RepID=UPI001CBC84D3|nr:MULTISPECIES: hypothetical protein [unclassified Corallococcus]MBZ4330291.1 hypothetical protein [Corallococcus sp. AS-1-12]MBZ4373678.1 hypothetical protein [Corallococcus sp. AS-1-6]